jgi:hypothetical protein
VFLDWQRGEGDEVHHDESVHPLGERGRKHAAHAGTQRVAHQEATVKIEVILESERKSRVTHYHSKALKDKAGQLADVWHTPKLGLDSTKVFI